MSQICIGDLELAINRCRQHLADRGAESATPLTDPASGELAALASLYGTMIYRGHSSIAPEEQGAAVQCAIVRWLASSDSADAPLDGCPDAEAGSPDIARAAESA